LTLLRGLLNMGMGFYFAGMRETGEGGKGLLMQIKGSEGVGGKCVVRGRNWHVPKT